MREWCSSPSGCPRVANVAIHSPLIVPVADTAGRLENKPPRWTQGLSLVATLGGVLVTIRVALALGLGSGAMGSPNVGDAVFLLAIAAGQTTLGLLFRRDAERLIREAFVQSRTTARRRTFLQRAFGTSRARAALGLAALVPVLVTALGDCALSAIFLKLAQS